MLQCDPGAGIAHRNRDELTLPGLGVFRQFRSGEPNPAGRYTQTAPMWHRVARINHQVHDHLFDHAGVRVDHWQPRNAFAVEINLLCDRRFKHFAQVLDQVIDAQGMGLDHLLAAEGQELPRQVGRAIGRRSDVAQTIRDRLRKLRALQFRQIGVPADDGQ